MLDDSRPNPDALLAEVLREEADSKLGRLFIFLGMCPGVGKTYAMLKAARQRKKEGVNVLVGVVETHGRSETAALLEGLNVLPKKPLEHRGHEPEEFDLDAVLDQRPSLVLVDELAHTNAPGSRHAKRYQDVLEIIGAGIDVYTTLNVQHIESQVDIVRQIVGVTIQETVPDSLLDRAHEIEVIDLSVAKLLDRMAAGKVYLGERADWATSNFFKESNLTALREMALRFTAEHVDRELEDIRKTSRAKGPWKTNARLLVGVGPSPYAESLIRWTRRAATRVNCPWLVVWVESSRKLSAEEQERLSSSLGLARRLGAEVVSVTSDNVPAALLKVAQERNVTQIVVGKPEKPSFFKRSLADHLILESGDVDVCVIRPLIGNVHRPAKIKTSDETSASLWAEYSWAVVIVGTLAGICWGALAFTGYTFVALVFLLGIVLAALRLSRGPILLMATISALAWDYFFITPQFTLHINNLEDVIMFGMFFIVALSMGHLTTRLRQRELAEKRRQQQTAALLQVTQAAALSAEPDKGLAEAIRIINHLLQADTALILRNDDRSLPTTAHPASTFTPTSKEWGVLIWSYEHKQTAGRFTDTLPQSDATWFPLQTATSLMGVFGVWLPHHVPLDFSTRQTIEALTLQLAIVLEKEHFIHAATHAELVEQSERLQRTLLDSVSHELKTPLAIIHASLEGLADVKNPYLDEIQTASKRLQRVVNNLLQMTRIESAILQPVREWCLLGDVIDQARETAGEALQKHVVNVDIPEELPPLKLDANLLAQALANVLHNAAIYTPANSLIEIKSSLHDRELIIRISDHGPGLPENAEEQIFTKFYRGASSPTGGTGLGLSISKALIHALGGDIKARNRAEGGAEFSITLPVEIFTFMNVRPRALVIDDEIQLRRLLRLALESKGYEVFEAEAGNLGLAEAAFQHPDVILLDLGLPDMDGIEVLKRLREWTQIPVLILSVRDQENVKVSALENGADDYVTKPFSTAELIARLAAIQRRRPPLDVPSQELGKLFLDFSNREVKLHGRTIKLTPIEYSLLKLLAQNVDKVITQKQILKEVWGPNATEQAQYLRVYVAHLRKILGEPEQSGIRLQNEPGIGYRLVIESDV